MGIIAHYKLNDNADTNVVVDDRGAHNGVYHGTGTTDDYTSAHTAANSRGVGTCLDFDGTQDYIEIADHNDFSFGDGTDDSPFSISAWIYMDSATTFPIVSKYIITDNNREWILRTANSRMNVYIYNLNGTGGLGRSYNTALSTGQWYHAVATYNGNKADSGIKIYIDGVRKDDTNTGGGAYTAMDNGTAPVYIGRISASYSDGKIDNVMIFNTELNIDQVKSLYNGGHGTEIVAVVDESRRIKRR